MKKLIAGLGNPGAKFEQTRHNLGARALLFLSGRAEWAGQPGLLVLLPQEGTFMNDSGQAIAAAARQNGIEPENILVIHDEAELEFGAVQLKEGGSAKGHNGVRSVIEAAGTDQFVRLRLGVGRPADESGLEEFVLGKFTAEEEEMLPKIFEEAGRKIEEWVGD